MDKLVEKINAQITNIARGDKSALGKLYEIAGGYLLAMARKYLWDKSYAEDIVSEVFLKIVRSAKDFDPDQNGLNWIFKITRNTALNFNKKENRYTFEDIESHHDIADVLAFTPEENSDMRMLRDKVAQLSKEEREILYFRYWEGYTVRELAQKTGKATMTLHDKLNRILKKLKKEL